MIVLTVDTSSAAVTAALVALDSVTAQVSVEVLAARIVLDARAHVEQLTPAIAACLAQAGRTPADLEAIVAGVGPGPFTGLRVGLATAQVLADLLAIPAYGVCSLDAIAASAGPGEVLVATDARRREVYWARYRDGVRQMGPSVSAPAEVVGELGLAAAVLPQLVAAGAGARMYRDVLGIRLREVDFPSPEGLASVAAERVLAKAPSEMLTPLYLRRPDAVAPGAPKQVSQPTAPTHADSASTTG